MRDGFLKDGTGERRLIEKVKKGDSDAFELMMSDYGKALYNYIAFHAGNAADVQDIMQETMLSIWQSIGAYDFQSSFKTWVFSIAKRRSADFYRKNGKHNILPLTEYADLSAEKDEIGESTDRMDIDRAIARLAKPEQELIWLVFQAQLSYQEIAEMLGIPVGTVKSRMSGVKAKLKKSLSGEG